MMLDYFLDHEEQPFSSTSVGGSPAVESADPPMPFTREYVEECLTRQELAVVTLASQDLTNKEIAARLNISEATVRRHRHNVYTKLHIHDTQTVRKFLRWVREHLPSAK